MENRLSHADNHVPFVVILAELVFYPSGKFFLKQGILIYVHARMQSCKLYLNKHAKDTDVTVFRFTRSPQACMNIFIYSYLRLQDILDDQGHPFGIKKKLRQR